MSGYDEGDYGGGSGGQRSHRGPNRQRSSGGHSGGFGGGGGSFGGPRRGGPRRDFDGPREMHKAICADCGQECEVPFKPAEGREVFCKECYRKKKGF